MITFFKLVLFLMFLYLIYKIFFSTPKKRATENRPQSLPEEMKLDPNCQTFIPQSQAVEKKIDGQIFYFCSEDCYREYLQKKKR